MKLKNLLHLVMAVLVGQFLFACNSAEYYRFSSAKPESYEKAMVKTEPSDALKENTPTVTEADLATPEKEAKVAGEATLEANAGPAVPVLFEKKMEGKKVAVAPKDLSVQAKEAAVVAEVKERLTSMTKAEKKEFKKEVKNAVRGTNAAGTVLKVILAFLIPPLAVFLHEGIGTRFWISILLTLLFVVPGIIYALLVVTDNI